ncbi:MAG: putative rRNA maturation factor, partial [Marinobacter sp. T13-3]
MSELTVDFQNVYNGKGVPGEEHFQTWAQLAWQGDEPSEVTVRIVDEPESQALNHQYR